MNIDGWMDSDFFLLLLLAGRWFHLLSQLLFLRNLLLLKTSDPIRDKMNPMLKTKDHNQVKSNTAILFRSLFIIEKKISKR